MRTKIMLFVLFISLLGLVFLSGCSTFYRTDDAVRIKLDSAKKYNNYPFNPLIIRNGNTLRGTVIKMETKIFPDTCPSTANTKLKSSTNILFLDKQSPSLEYIEYIPVEDVDLIGPKFGKQLNVFENFNFPLEPKKFREVPWDTILVECRECGCSPFSLSLYPPRIEIECPTRKFNWYFIEFLVGYAVYNDYITPTQRISSDGVMGELAAGFRFGNRKQYGFGLMLSTGLTIYNSFTSDKKQRPLALLHLRWEPWKNTFNPNQIQKELEPTEPCPDCENQMEQIHGKRYGIGKAICISPYFFFDFGLPFDKFSLDLLKLNFNTKCKNQIKSSAPFLNIDLLPITFALGGGIDIPLSKYFDLSIDVGWRNYAFGESQTILGFANVPSYRRVNIFFFRTGITL